MVTHLLLNLLLFLLGSRGSSGSGGGSRSGNSLSVLGLQELLLLVLRETGEVSSGNSRVIGSRGSFSRSLLRTKEKRQNDVSRISSQFERVRQEREMNLRLLLLEFLNSSSSIFHILIIGSLDQTRNVGIVEFVFIEIGTVFRIRVRILVEVFLADVVTSEVDRAVDKSEAKVSVTATKGKKKRRNLSLTSHQKRKARRLRHPRQGRR